jgi:hypothetical protein
LEIPRRLGVVFSLLGNTDRLVCRFSCRRDR